MGSIPEASLQVSWVEFETALKMWRAGEKESQEAVSPLASLSAYTLNPQRIWDSEQRQFFQVESTTGILVIHKAK